MKRIHLILFLVVAILSLIIGCGVGFFLGVASTEAGKRFLEDLAEEEQKAEVTQPQNLVRDRFKLQYPSNWKIDVNDEDYDPDQMFSLDSPGATFVRFVLDDFETDPEDNLQDQVNAFTKLMGSPTINRFDSYGQYKGNGATLSGKILGIGVRVKIFSCFADGMTAIIIQQYPDEDLKYVKDGLDIIEKSFKLLPESQQDAPGS